MLPPDNLNAVRNLREVMVAALSPSLPQRQWKKKRSQAIQATLERPEILSLARASRPTRSCANSASTGE
jgi:hypothetical protein